MRNLTISGQTTAGHTSSNSIYCPSLHGLSAQQADLAFIMPRLDHNKAVRAHEGNGCWAGVLASDPFGSETALFRKLRTNGYKGITNWPSSILLEGVIQQSMSTVPATPQFEYAFLKRAQDNGLATLAFFVSLEQGRQAIEAGLTSLVLHPGILDEGDNDSAALVRSSLQTIVSSIKDEGSNISVFAYTSDHHERQIGLHKLQVDGFIRFVSSK
jgi:predicted TIM-barrel enzyme